MEFATRFQILDEAVCISLYANALGKGMISWVNSRADWVLYSLCGNLSRKKKPSKFKPAVLHSKSDFVSHPA